MADNSTPSNDARDLALLFSIGALNPDEERAFREHLDKGDRNLTAEWRAVEETVGQAALALPPVAPRPVLREKLLARVRPPVTQFAPGIFVARASESGWRRTKSPGVTFKELYVDPKTQMATSLLRLAPGARYPAHRHTAVEQCLVLEGEVELGDLRLSAGDYEWAEASTTHDLIRSETGCLLLIMSSKHDEFLEGH